METNEYWEATIWQDSTRQAGLVTAESCTQSSMA